MNTSCSTDGSLFIDNKRYKITGGEKIVVVMSEEKPDNLKLIVLKANDDEMLSRPFKETDVGPRLFEATALKSKTEKGIYLDSSLNLVESFVGDQVSSLYLGVCVFKRTRTKVYYFETCCNQ